MKELVILSDLHIGGGHAGEHFFADQALERFLGYLASRVAGERSCRLLLLGDSFDLSEIDGQAAAKLEHIAAGHPGVFTALAGFLRAGGSIDVVPGNHDLELTGAAAQAALRSLLAAGDPDAGARLAFHPWIYYVPGVVYAEHGSQYHDINAVATVVRPWEADEHGPLQWPLARHLERYHADRRRSAPSLRRRLELAAGLARDLRRLSSRDRAERRASYRAEVLTPYADRLGLPEETVAAIDTLSRSSARSIAARLGKRGVVVGARWAGRRRPLVRPAERAAYLHRAWPAIHRLLAGAGAAVPFYVFGHTHHAERRGTPEQGTYLNCGTWSCYGHSADGTPGPLTFVQIEWGAAGKPVAALMRWDPEVEDISPLHPSSPKE